MNLNHNEVYWFDFGEGVVPLAFLIQASYEKFKRI